MDAGQIVKGLVANWGWLITGFLALVVLGLRKFIARLVGNGAEFCADHFGVLPRRFQTWLDNDKPSVLRFETISLSIPPLGDRFTGRVEQLLALERDLTGRSRSASLSQCAAVRADGGIGKTTLAAELGHRLFQRRKFDVVLFLNATSPDDLDRDLSGLCARLDLPAKDEKELAPRRDAVLAWLREPAHARRTLLILDNADSPEAQERARQLHRDLSFCALLITSRGHVSRDIPEHQIDLFTPAEARAFLRLRLPKGRPAPDADLDAIAEAVDHFPLALEIVASYLARTHQTPAEWLREWQATPASTLAHHDPSETRYRVSLSRVWEQSFERLSAEARDLLRALALIAPRPAEFPLARLKQDKATWLPRRDLLIMLREAALITWDDATDSVAIHRVLQAVIRHHQPPDQAAAARRLGITLLAAATPSWKWSVSGWALWERLVPHYQAILAAVRDTAEESDATGLMNRLGLWLRQRAQNKDAEPLYRRALEIDDKSLGPEHPVVAVRLNNLALLLKATNRLTDAESLYRRALEIDEKSFGPDHPEVATDLNNLAQLLQATNRLTDAEPLMRRALEIDEKSLGLDHSHVATRLNNLASLLQATGRLTAAEPLMRRALEISEKSLGPDHPDVAIRLNNLASLFQATSRLTDAEPLLRRALEILLFCKIRTGFDVPKLAVAIQNYRGLLKALQWSNEKIDAHLRELEETAKRRAA